MVKKKNSGQLRDCTFTLEKVLAATATVYDKKWLHLAELDAFIDADSYNLWKQKGVSCIICGITASFFAKERTPGTGSMFNRWHLNLYAIDEKGFEVQMTKDHITSKAKGGPEYGIDNLQPMCYPHNQKKAHHHMDDFMVKVRNNEGIIGEEWDEAAQRPVIKKSAAVVRAEQRWAAAVDSCITNINNIYGIKTNKGELSQAIAGGTKIKLQNLHSHVLLCHIQEAPIYVVYNFSQQLPVAVLPPASLQEMCDKLPAWAMNKPNAPEILAEYKLLMTQAQEIADKAGSMDKAEGAAFVLKTSAKKIAFALMRNDSVAASMAAWTELMRKHDKKHNKQWRPVFYWTGILKRDAELINKPHIEAEGLAEDRTNETYDLIQTCIDYTHFDLKDALNLQNRLLSINNWKGIKPGLRTHNVNFKETPKWQLVEEQAAKLFPVQVGDEATLLEWYRKAAIVHPFSDLNGRVLGIIVAVLNFNYKKKQAATQSSIANISET